VKILYYITSHGYGHALRSSVVCTMLPENADIVIRTAVPLEFFKREIKRPFSYEPAAFDCGCVQPDGNCIDIPGTLAAYREIADRNRSILDKEASWCGENGVTVIVSDIVPFAFDVAGKAGIPSVAATNFTWHTIYEEYTERFPGFSPWLDAMREQYARADVLCAMHPANDMAYFPKQIPVEPVGRVGSDIRGRLCSAFGIPPEKKIGLIYTGNFGMGSLPWKLLEAFDEWEFFSLYPLPGSPGNCHLVSTHDYRYQDCMASADVMVSKLGYGVVAECLINGLPIIYLPRTGFAEYPVLERAVEKWGHGYFLSKEEYCSLQWREALASAVGRGKPLPMRSTGARQCAEEIENLCQTV
jgi:hypothetical protein